MTHKYVATISFSNGQSVRFQNNHDAYELDAVSIAKRNNSTIVVIAFQVDGVDAGSVIIDD